MRSRILTALCTLSLSGSLLGPLATSTNARAQEGEAEATGDETQGGDIVDVPAQAGAPGADPSAPGTVHTVETGDTLWDLSQRYLGSPWYWPKVWSYNPEIANPHWIYPGNRVKFFAGGEETPTRIDVGSDALEAPTREPDTANFSVAGTIGYQGPTTRRVVHDGFVSTNEIQASGRIEKSFSEAQMLTVFDTVYVRFENAGDARVGDRYVIFRTTDELEHPVKGGTFGYLTKYVGVMQVTNIGNKLVTAQIISAQDEIRRGDLVGPWGEQLIETVSERPNDQEVSAFVVSGMIPYLSILGEHHDLVIDKGSADGVQQGNVFTVLRQQDLGGNFMNPAEDQDEDLPIESIARCMAVTVRENATTCTLTQSIREVVPGDRAVMIPAQGGAPSARR